MNALKKNLTLLVSVAILLSLGIAFTANAQLSGPSTTTPSISRIWVDAVTDTSAALHVEYRTNPAGQLFFYGSDDGLSFNKLHPNAITVNPSATGPNQNTFPWTNLAPNTTYHFNVSVDSATAANTISFTTLAGGASPGTGSGSSGAPAPMAVPTVFAVNFSGRVSQPADANGTPKYYVQATVDIPGDPTPPGAYEIRFGSNPNNLNTVVDTLTSATLPLSFIADISEAVAGPMTQGKDYYIGLFTTSGTLFAIQNLGAYGVSPFSGVAVDWSPDLLQQASPGDPFFFNLEGTVTPINRLRNITVLKFGDDPRLLIPVAQYDGSYPETFSFLKAIGDTYTSITSGLTYTVKQNELYYAAIFDGGVEISRILVGSMGQGAATLPGPTPGEAEGEQAGGNFNPNTAESLGLVDGTANNGTSLATQNGGLVPCDETEIDCDYNKLIELVSNGINFIFILIIPIAAIAFAYAGVLLVTGGSSPDKRKKAKDVFLKVLVGIVIIMIGWLIVATILKALGVTEGYILLESL